MYVSYHGKDMKHKLQYASTEGHERQSRILFTREGYEKIAQEKKKLLNDRLDAVEHLRKAREMGDLSENGYYKAARQRLSFIDAQLRKIHRLMSLAQVVPAVYTGVVNIGSTVTIHDEEGEQTYTIVGGYESDPLNNAISYMSPIGKALMNKKEGESVEVKVPSGIKRITIRRIR
jgi:transcription elongation factor GreA